MNNRDYTNLYQGGHKYKNLRQQVKGESKLFFDKIVYIRIPLAIILVLVLLFMTGYVSNIFGDRLNFQLAKKLVLFPSWMEKYNPDQMALYDAGIIFQEGKYNEALNEFYEIQDLKRAQRMVSLTKLKIAEEDINTIKYDDAFNLIIDIDSNKLSYMDIEEYKSTIEILKNHYENDYYTTQLNELLNNISQ